MKRTACGCDVGDEAPHGGLDEAMRAAGVPRDDSGRGGVPLDGLAVGSRARVVDVRVPGVPALERRLEDLGFVPGRTVEVLRRAPLGDPVVYRVCDYELCLRHAQAARVLVDPVGACASAGALARAAAE